MNKASIIESLKSKVRDVPNFPKEGIIFKDITTLLKDQKALQDAAQLLIDAYKDKGITKVVGIESRGFILGSILAYHLNAGFVLLRKPGKLPADCHKISYELEYGTDSLEIHKDAINEDDVVLIHDDLLATGGSAKAAMDLVNIFNPKEIYFNFLIELSFLNGQEKLPESAVYSLLKY